VDVRDRRAKRDKESAGRPVSASAAESNGTRDAKKAASAGSQPTFAPVMNVEAPQKTLSEVEHEPFQLLDKSMFAYSTLPFTSAPLYPLNSPDQNKSATDEGSGRSMRLSDIPHIRRVHEERKAVDALGEGNDVVPLRPVRIRSVVQDNIIGSLGMGFRQGKEPELNRSVSATSKDSGLVIKNSSSDVNMSSIAEAPSSRATRTGESNGGVVDLNSSSAEEALVRNRSQRNVRFNNDQSN